jgi:FkbM family methyltransferase
MKHAVRALLRRAGFELLHRDDDPILRRMRQAHESLRLAPGDRTRWDDTLPRLAAEAHLRHLLDLHRIDLVIDVGANRGQFAHLLRELGYRGEIASFEPLARHHAALKAAAAADGRWRIFPFALGETEGEAALHVYPDDTFSSLHSVNRAGHERFTTLVAAEEIERVPVRRLDALWSELARTRPVRVFLKTDTQGHDLAVLAGAETILPQTFGILAEAPFTPIYDDVPSHEQLARWLGARGFVPSGIFPISHRVENLALIEVDACFTRANA